MLGTMQNPQVSRSGLSKIADVSFPIRLRRSGRQGFVAGETIRLSAESLLVRAEENFEEGGQVTVEIVVAQDRPASVMLVGPLRAGTQELFFIDPPEPVKALLDRLLTDHNAFGDFAIEALIGTGGMAEVYRVLAKRGPHSGSVLALKRLAPVLELDPVQTDLFLSEADLLRMLEHPNIVDIKQTGVVDNTYYIAMEYLAHGSISDLMRDCREAHVQLPVDLCCYIAGIVANALEYIHTFETQEGQVEEIVHRDVTPSNILIGENGEVKLTDFGVAYMGTLAGEEEAIVGKALYQPPEQANGGRLSADSDVFALAAVLYEMLTGRPAFDGENVGEVQKRIRRYRVTPPHELRPEVPQALSALVMLGLSPDRAIDRLGVLTRLWRATFGRRIPKRIATAAEFGARVRVFSEPLYASPEVVRVVVERVREIGRQRPLFAPLDAPPLP